MAVMANVLDLLLPSRCAGCGAVGTACCARCLLAFRAPERVRKAAAPAGLPLYAMARYSEVRTLLVSYKERGRRDLGRPLGAVLARGAGALACGEAWLVPVPSRRAAASARGGQHMLRVARCGAAALARSGVPAGVAPALRMARGVRDSVGLSRAQRSANLGGRIHAVPRGLPPGGRPVLLLDDVTTTGATVAACAAALERAGTAVAAVLVLAATP